jgi:hypothetical protein
MRKSIVFSALFIWLLLVKCSVSPTLEEAFDNKAVLIGEEVFMDSVFYAQPKSIEIMDTIMIIVDEYQGKFFTAIDLKNNRLVNRFGYKGRGPNELDRVDDVVFWKEERIVSFKISNPTRYWYFSMADIAGSEVLFREKLSFKFERSLATFFHFVPIRSKFEKYIGTGMFPEGMYGICRADGNMDTIIGRYTVAKENELVDNFTLGSGYQGMVRPHPELPLIAYISYRHDLVEVIDCTNDHYTIKKFHGGGFPELSVDGQKMRLNLATAQGFSSLSVTKNFIYGLFSGKKEENAYGGVKSYSNLVYVFDWNLNPIICYELDHDLRTIKVSDDDQTLYSFALNNDDEMVLMHWQLNH